MNNTVSLLLHHSQIRRLTQSLHYRSLTTESWARWMTTETPHSPLNTDEAPQTATRTPQQERNDDDNVFADWIPPDRPLVADDGDTNNGQHWLTTRRQRLEKPDRNRQYVGAELEVKPGFMLSSEEIKTCLSSMGGVDCRAFDSNSGVGMMVATATSQQHLSVLSDTLVRQLKLRKLADYGVQGAKLGAEKGAGWNVIDCHNYVVHIVLEDTRRSLNLEALWSGDDDMFQIRFNDEDSVDDYVAKNPVPASYGSAADEVDVPGTVNKLQRWNLGHKEVVKKPPKKKGERRMNRDSRLL